jgi:hypothetical protein
MNPLIDIVIQFARGHRRLGLSQARPVTAPHAHDATLRAGQLPPEHNRLAEMGSSAWVRPPW